jgi:hypothetical protein
MNGVVSKKQKLRTAYVAASGAGTTRRMTSDTETVKGKGGRRSHDWMMPTPTSRDRERLPNAMIQQLQDPQSVSLGRVESTGVTGALKRRNLSKHRPESRWNARWAIRMQKKSW